MARKTKKPKWKPGKIAKKVLAILATIFLPVIGIALAAVIGQEVGNSIAGPAGSATGGVIGAVVGIATVGIVGIAYFTRKKLPPKEPEPQSELTSPVTQPEPALQHAVNQETVERERDHYVCNSNTHEIHDTKNLQPACNFEMILEEHKIKLGSLTEVEEAIKNQGYDGCRWCMSQYDTG